MELWKTVVGINPDVVSIAEKGKGLERLEVVSVQGDRDGLVRIEDERPYWEDKGVEDGRYEVRGGFHGFCGIESGKTHVLWGKVEEMLERLGGDWAERAKTKM